MSDNNRDYGRKVPAWVTILVVICMLPVLAFPTMLTMTMPDSSARTFVWFYPFYVIASGICARICWPQRKDVMWVLLALMVLSHLAMWMLVLNDNVI